MDSQRRLVLVTGASAGLGAEFARVYAKRGYDLALTARRADRLQALAKELSGKHGIEAFAIPQDLAAFEAHKPILEAVAARGRTVDVLINNAGFGIPQSYLGVPWERQREFLMTLVVNACGLAYGAAAGMIEARAGGAIINVASVAGFAPGVAGNSLYPAAKSFAIKFSQSLHAELKPQGVKVTALCPGFTRTDFHHAAGIAHMTHQAPRMFWHDAETVVEAGIRANEAGRAVVVPGWWNRVGEVLMTRLPSPWVRSLIGKAAEKYRPEAPERGSAEWEAQARQRLRALLRDEWDPIGMMPHLPADEYDSYALKVWAMLIEGASVGAVAAYLAGVDMGVARGRKKDQAVAERAWAIVHR